MKRFMKICGIVVGIVLIVGLVLVTIGGVGGGCSTVKSMAAHGDLSIGTKEFFKWDGDWVWNDEWETYDLDEDSLFSSSHDVIRNQSDYSTSFSAEDVKTLDIELGGCKVVLAESSDDDIHVVVNKVYAFQSYLGGDTLYIRGIKTGRWVTWDLSTGMLVTIEVPSTMKFAQADISMGAGIFEIDTVAADKCKIAVGAGEVSVNDLAADELEIQIGAGHVVVRDAQTQRKVKLSVGAGELSFKGEIPGDLKAECGLGSLQVTVTGSSEKDHNYKMNCMAGRLSAGGHEAYGLAVEHEYNNNATSDYDLECAMGNLEIDFK